jgi:uncharacterized protein
MPVEPFTHSSDPPVRGFLHTPATPNRRAIVLSHGAGSNARAPLLVALAETFSAAGFTVLRCDLPYRQIRSWGPPGPADAARDRAGLRNAVMCMKEILGAPLKPDSGLTGDFPVSGEVFLAGHSYGGRQSSMLCAEDPAVAAGLLLLSYPLHPPRKPEQQRTQHLPDLRTPAFFVSGTRDPFGSIAELSQALKMIPAKTKLVAIEGAGHDLGFKGKTTDSMLPQTILEAFLHFFS